MAPGWATCELDEADEPAVLGAAAPPPPPAEVATVYLMKYTSYFLAIVSSWVTSVGMSSVSGTARPIFTIVARSLRNSSCAFLPLVTFDCAAVRAVLAVSTCAWASAAALRCGVRTIIQNPPRSTTARTVMIINRSRRVIG